VSTVAVYSLGAVKPHVKDAAYALGPKHGFTVIYGWGLGSTPNSDHPKGLALDFMTKSRAQGDALVAELIANAGSYSVKYIIWYRRIWEDGQWRTYSGSNPHTDHVHVSFKDTASGTIPTTTVAGGIGLPGPLDEAAGQVRALFQVFEEINTGLKWITDKHNWFRIGLFIGGSLILLFGLLWILGRTKQAKDAVRATADIIGATGSKTAKGATNAKS
jgi:hypothetical protein